MNAGEPILQFCFGEKLPAVVRRSRRRRRVGDTELGQRSAQLVGRAFRDDAQSVEVFPTGRHGDFAEMLQAELRRLRQQEWSNRRDLK
jgi:hypothetical protein